MDNEIAVRPKNELAKFCFPEANNQLAENERNANALLNAVLANVPNAMNIQQASSLGSAYKAVGDVALQQNADGTFAAVLRGDDGKIIEHVPLEKASSDFATSFKMGYAVNCAIAGQAQMMQIAKQLEEINESIVEIKDLMWQEKIRDVESAISEWERAFVLKEKDKSVWLNQLCNARTSMVRSLGHVYDYMKSQLDRLPAKTNASGFFENWGFGKTDAQKAAEHFRYFARLLPVFCRGMAMMVMTDAYFGDMRMSDGIKFAKGLKQLFVDARLSERVRLVPMLGKVNPEKVVKDFSQGIDYAVEYFDNYNSNMDSQQFSLVIPCAKDKDRLYVQV